MSDMKRLHRLFVKVIIIIININQKQTEQKMNVDRPHNKKTKNKEISMRK